VPKAGPQQGDHYAELPAHLGAPISAISINHKIALQATVTPSLLSAVNERGTLRVLGLVRLPV
jgi:hypothetical protein